MFSQMRNIIFVCIILVVFGSILRASPTEEELNAIHEGLRDALNTQDVNGVISYFHDDATYDYVPLPPIMKGKEEIATFFEDVFTGFPDFHVDQRNKLISDNILITECTITATHMGELYEVPGTGNPVQLMHMDIYEFEDDKIEHMTTYDDAASFLVQFGVMPVPDLDPALLVPSFPLPDPEPSGLAPMDAALELDALYDAHDIVNYAKKIHPNAEILLAPFGVPMNRDAFIAILELYFLGFPDLNQEISNSIDIGDGWVAFEGKWKGMNDGPYFGMPATRRYSEVRGAWIARFDVDGLMTNLSVYFDNITILANLGLFPPPDPEANKALIRRQTEEIWNQGNLSLIDEIYAADYVRHDPGSPEISGSEGLKQLVTAYRVAFPDIHFTIEDMIAEGDLVVARSTGIATHEGEFMGIPPTGVKGPITIITMFRIVDGKIAEEWSEWDALGMMEQLGVMPPTREDYSWGAPSEVTGDPGDPVANTALVLYVVQKFWNEYNVTVLDNTHSPESIAHNPVIPGQPLPFNMYKQVCLIHLAAFPDFRVTIEDTTAEGDEVALRWTVTGTHKGELMGIPASGKPVKFTGVTVYRFTDGKIVENWWAYDALGMMQQITAPPSIPEELVVDQITSPSLEGNLLGDPATREVVIYLPPTYSDGGNFPVVYLLHGYGGGARLFAAKDHPAWKSPLSEPPAEFPEKGICGILDDLMTSSTLEEMIVVMPDGSNLYGGSFYTNSELSGNYEDYIVDDLVSYIDDHYRTIRDPHSRAIVGHSMGGYGAMKLAMKHPEVFGIVASHSGALYLDGFKAMTPLVIQENPNSMMGPDPSKPFTTASYAMSAAFSPNLNNPPFFVDLVFEYPSPEIIDEIWSKWLEHDVFTMLDEYGSNMALLKGIYLDVGNQDELAMNFQSEAFHQALAAAGIAHEYEVFAGGHTNRIFERLALSLQFLSDLF